ncbi:HSPB1-associated protein 1 [Seminavis robusta]|uniref:HSPB1-associated protein 1 n=1 Tax=Seminavis robusta TaxID=568900 RepID=A0A9N8HK00_9STRA|nr:HSPB1-associated protein 1 [Seminavis robusta]|eukprot:Sro801_g204440.1 HSPB1-associated protein 1 (402) ;mRNA; f:12322-13622
MSSQSNTNNMPMADSSTTPLPNKQPKQVPPKDLENNDSADTNLFNPNAEPIDILYEWDEELIKRNYVLKKPFILRGTQHMWPASQWSFDYLRDNYGSFKSSAVSCWRREKTSSSYFMQNILNETNMTFQQFFDEHFDKGHAEWAIKEDGDFFEEHPALKDAVPFAQVYAGANPLEASIKTPHLWIGPKNNVTGLHADLYEWNMNFQIQGRKLWKFYSPVDEPYLYMQTKVALAGGHYSHMDVFRPDMDKYPLFVHATEYQCIVEPGDIVYIPYRWWHAVYSLDTTLGVNFIVGDNIRVWSTYLEFARLAFMSGDFLWMLAKIPHFSAELWLVVQKLLLSKEGLAALSFVAVVGHLLLAGGNVHPIHVILLAVGMVSLVGSRVASSCGGVMRPAASGLKNSD